MKDSFGHFEFKSVHPITTVTVITNNFTLSEILQDFEHFLRGCGFVFDGRLEIVEEDQ